MSVVKFPSRLKPVALRRTQRHSVAVGVIDTNAPEDARWRAQRAISRAAGFGALSGFTDVAAVRGTRHNFEVRDALLSRMLRDFAPLVERERVQLRVDGHVVRRLEPRQVRVR